MELGHQGLAALFAVAEPDAQVGPQGSAICLRPGGAELAPQAPGPEALTAEDDGDGEDWDDQEPDDDAPDQDVSAEAKSREVAVSKTDADTAATATPPRQGALPLGDPESASRVPAGTAATGAANEESAVARHAAGSTAEPPAFAGFAQPSTNAPTQELPSGTGTAAGTGPDGDGQPPLPLPERILIGTRKGGEPVYWHFGDKRLPNRHLLVFGTSGSGKTYGIQCLLAEMAAARLHALIIDYTNGFLPGQMQERFKTVAAPLSHFVRRERLPLNPFRRQRQVLDPSVPPIEEGSYDVATRIQSIFASVYDLGDQQAAALVRALQSGIDLNPAFTLDDLLPRLREDSSQGATLANKLEPLIQARPFQEGATSAWAEMLGAPAHPVHVLQLAGLAREIQKLVTEFVLWDLWDYAQSSGSEQRPIPIVLDEVQNLDHNDDSPIDKMLREGRKLGIALLLATQTTSNFTSAQRDRLFQAGHKLFFKPATTETDRFAQILAQATPGIFKGDWVSRLARLEKGQCWSLGPMLRADGRFREEAVLVSVTALEARQFERWA